MQAQVANDFLNAIVQPIRDTNYFSFPFQLQFAARHAASVFLSRG